MMKKKRQAKIIELIDNNIIDKQELLKELLGKEGIDVTQATLSRDIRELKLEKGYDKYKNYRYLQPDISLPEFPPMFIDTLVSVDYGMNMVVLKCHVGMASGAAAILDKIDYGELLGTIAGDDTIFVLMKSEDKAKCFCDTMRKLIIKK